MSKWGRVAGTQMHTMQPSLAQKAPGARIQAVATFSILKEGQHAIQ